jgi:hypothetical protein
VFLLPSGFPLKIFLTLLESSILSTCPIHLSRFLFTSVTISGSLYSSVISEFVRGIHYNSRKNWKSDSVSNLHVRSL